MFRCVTKISIQQITTSASGVKRNKLLLFDFVNSFNCSSNWTDLTNNGKIIIPKNIAVRDKMGKLVPIYDNNNPINGWDSNTPLFLRGDSVTINFGYRYSDSIGNDILDIAPLPIFTGYITKVVSKKPIELEIEDSMWLLKQIPAQGGDNGLFRQSAYTWEQALREMLKTTPFKVNALTETSIGDFRVENETVCQVLDRVRKDYHLEAYFANVIDPKTKDVVTELRTGSKVYIDSEAVTSVFKFQYNIIDDNLDYSRKDDVILSAICYSVNKFTSTEMTKRGKTKTKSERLEILVYWDFNKQVYKYIKKQNDVSYPPNIQGERRTFYFWNIKNETDLFDQGVLQLKKYYYTGFKGSFTTFAIPYVKLGDNVALLDNILPERNGLYKVRGVEYSGGVGGHRQTISLDYLIYPLNAKGQKMVTGKYG